MQLSNDYDSPQLVVMLTHNDFTSEDAEEIFETCKDSKARFWGFKEKPLPLHKMKRLFQRMKDCGKTTFLEVVAYDEVAGMEGARLARDCGCDILMGTTFHRSISDFCRDNNIGYFPFVGKIEGRPSVLTGEISEIVQEAIEAIEDGASGIDLLGYRYTGDVRALIREIVEKTPAPVCVAGSIDCKERLEEIKEIGPWAFTIGSAFFDRKFGATFEAQIDRVCGIMEKD